MKKVYKRSLVFFAALLSLLLLSNCNSKKKKPTAPPADKKEMSAEAHKESHDSQKPHWAYEGLFGPEAWGDLNESYSACKSGKSQSPINLVWKKPVKAKGEVEFHFIPTEYKIANNGHSVQVNFPKGQWTKIRGEVYELLQLHFHNESEHTLSGKHYPLEMHLVHVNSHGQLAVVGLLFQEGKHNPYLAQLWEKAPAQKGIEVGVKELFDINGLLPKMHHYYQYSGSLTTPPCSEGVDWNVFNTPVEMSNEQILEFKKLYSGNYRPLQPLNDRKVVNY